MDVAMTGIRSSDLFYENSFGSEKSFVSQGGSFVAQCQHGQNVIGPINIRMPATQIGRRLFQM